LDKTVIGSVNGFFRQSEAADSLEQVLSPIGDEIAKI
jgi:hypothetical protein